MRRTFRCLLAVALATVAATARAAEVDPLLPKECEQVIQINVKQVVDSDVFKRNFLKPLQKVMQRDEVKAQLDLFGIDPLKDLEKVTIGIYGDKKPEETKVLAVLRGTFNAEKLFDGVQDTMSRLPDQIAIESVEDGDEKWKLVKATPNRGQPPFYGSVANDKTLVLGNDGKLVAAALTAAKTKAKAKLGKEMTNLVLKQDEKASVFYCSVLEGRIEVDKIPEGAFAPLAAFGIEGETLKKQIAAMSTFAATVRLGKEVGLALTAGMKDEDTAEEFGGAKSNLTKLLDTAKNFMPLLYKQEPKFEALVTDISKTIQAKVKGKDVTVSASATLEAIAKAFQQDEEE